MRRNTGMTNTNPETGIRYGIISANNIDPDVMQIIWLEGTDLHWQDRAAEIRDEVMNDEECSPDDKDAEIERRLQDESDGWYDDEPVHSFELSCPGYGVVHGRTTWLGGGQLVWIFKSPFLTKAKLCSPCVPNAGDLNNPDVDGYECYDVPNDWRYEDGDR